MSGTFEQITPNLWLLQSEYFHTNSGVFIDNGQAALIDPGITPEEVGTTIQFLKEKRGRTEVILLTHAHWDHILGPQMFPGVKVIAQKNYLKETSGESGDRLKKRVERFYDEINCLQKQAFCIPQPDLTFEDTLEVTIGKQQLRLMQAPGHVSSQMAVYHPEGEMLWAADMLSNIEIPLVSQHLASYEKTLTRFSNLNIKVLIPGHGSATTNNTEIRERINSDIAYLVELRWRVEESIKDGKSIEKTVDYCRYMTYKHPDENAAEHQINVERAFLELDGKTT